MPLIGRQKKAVPIAHTYTGNTAQSGLE